MKKLMILLFLSIGGRAFSQSYVDSVLIHGARMDSVHFELKLDTMILMRLYDQYNKEQDLPELIDIRDRLDSLRRKMDIDMNWLYFESGEVIRFYNKMSTKELWIRSS